MSRLGLSLQIVNAILLLTILAVLVVGSGGAPDVLRREEDLVQMLLAVERERDQLRQELTELESELAVATRDQLAHTSLERELERARIAAGFVAVVGPGLTVKLTDSEYEAGADDNQFIVHDDDILRVVNELFSAGAEAIAINGQRVIATTEIRCAGPTIAVNNTRTAPPVIIVAIGDPEVMTAALEMRGGVLQRLAVWGIGVEIEVYEQVTVPAYSGPLLFRYAIPEQT